MASGLVRVQLQLPRSALRFIDFLCSISGVSRDEWFQHLLKADLQAFLDEPWPHWDSDHLEQRFGLSGFLAKNKDVEDC